MNKKKGSVYIKEFLVLNILMACLSLCTMGSALAFDSPGVTLSIHAEPGDDGNLVYNLGQDSVPFHVVLRSDPNISIATERDFSKLELHHTLVVTDPNNNKYVLRPSDHDHKMPPPTFINSIPYSPAEAIAPGWVKSTAIDDLRNLVPEMYTLPGWYTIVAEQPYVRFAKTVNFYVSYEEIEKLGVQGDEKNWTGVLVSNTMEVYIKPPGGARVEVELLDNSIDPPGKLFHVPVRIFKEADVPVESEPQDIWSTVPYVVEKYSDNGGIAVLVNKSGCLSQDDYLIIAKYAAVDNEGNSVVDYQEGNVAYTDARWVSEGCASMIYQAFGFGEPAPPEAIPGDLDGDGDVDRNDMNIILTHRNQPASECLACDIDGDGIITVLDARKLVLLCTRTRCATE